MMKNFRVVSVSAMMAAFAATSAFAAVAKSSCPSATGWAVNSKGDCYFTIQSVKDTTINIPTNLETFGVVYDGADDGKNGKINIHCDNHLNTVSITPIGKNLNSGSSFSIRNRLNAVGLGIDDPTTLMMVESIQPTKDMYTCTESATCPGGTVTGLNALSIVFDAKSGDKKNQFALMVSQEQYDFGPMQVLNIDGFKEVAQSNPLVQLALKTNLGMDITTIPDGVTKGLLLRGQYKTDDEVYPLNGLTQDIEVGYVYLDRTFTTNDAVENARSTIAFPFDIATDNILGASEILQFTRIGKDAKGNDAVFMKKVYCFEGPDGDKCPAKNGTLKAYKPYIVQLLGEEWTDDGKPATSLTISGGVTLKATTMEAGYADFADPDSWWVFRGVFEKITWDKAPANTYGYAASGKDEKGNDLAGRFVKVGAGAYIYPFRGVLTYAEPLKAAPANSSYALRPNVLPDEMNIVVEGDNNETTVIGRFNTRTGEMKFINNLKHTYDLKGRRVNGVNNARGAYYGKKVMR